MRTEDADLLVRGAEAIGIPLHRGMVEAFDQYLRELLKWNRKINLTAIRTEREIVLKHFLDSLSVHPFVSESATLLDIGSGAGFPGIPLKIIQPSRSVTLIDSVRKKVDFQRHVIRVLGLSGIEAIHGRVQDRTVMEALGDRFDAVISRAFSDLETLLSLSLPFVKRGGTVLAMKGKMREEGMGGLSDRARALFRLERVIPLRLPFTSLQRSLMVFQRL